MSSYEKYIAGTGAQSGGERSDKQFSSGQKAHSPFRSCHGRRVDAVSHGFVRRRLPFVTIMNDSVENGTQEDVLPSFGRYDAGIQSDDAISDVIEPIIMADQKDRLSFLFQVRQ